MDKIVYLRVVIPEGTTFQDYDGEELTLLGLLDLSIENYDRDVIIGIDEIPKRGNLFKEMKRYEEKLKKK